MREYLDLVETALTRGKAKPTRAGNTLMVNSLHFRHDMAEGFPIPTTRKLGIKNNAVELEGFLHGITDKGWYQQRGCRFWDHWANPVTAKLNGQTPAECPDLGPIYGWQWRNWGRLYPQQPWGGIGFDQVERVLQTLRKNPDDRRMVVSAWNPTEEHLMALPPCHLMWNITHCNGVINLNWAQRSADIMIGVPADIIFYGMLLELICHETGMIPGELTAVFWDAHIYENHVDNAKIQLMRPPRTHPKLHMEWKGGIYDWTHKDVSLIGYDPYSGIKFDIAV